MAGILRVVRIAGRIERKPERLRQAGEPIARPGLATLISILSWPHLHSPPIANRRWTNRESWNLVRTSPTCGARGVVSDAMSPHRTVTRQVVA